MRGKISIDSLNRAYIVLDILTKDGTKKKPIEFKFDPGADCTTISQEDLKSLGYVSKDIKDRMYLQGEGTVASGGVAYHYAIDLSFTNLLGMVMPKGLTVPFVCLRRREVKERYPVCRSCEFAGTIDEGFRSLLGNDLLSCFNITINRDAYEIAFERVASLDIRNAMYHWCQMYSVNHFVTT